MNKMLIILAAGTCFGASLYGPAFPPDLQRRVLGKDPVVAAAAAKEALRMYGSQPLKLVTYLGMTTQQLEQIAAGKGAQKGPQPTPTPGPAGPERKGGNVAPGGVTEPMKMLEPAPKQAVTIPAMIGPAPSQAVETEGVKPQRAQISVAPLIPEETHEQVLLQAERRKTELPPIYEQVRIEKEAEANVGTKAQG